MIANQFVYLKSYQEKLYNYQPVPPIVTYLNTCVVLEEESLYAMSLRCEPRVDGSTIVKPIST